MAGSNTADTILAVSSPPGAGSVCIVRLSGPRALGRVAFLAGLDGSRILACRGFSEVQASLQLDALSLPVRVAVYRSPRSYTGEDLCEITLPGSLPLVSLLTRRLIASSPDSEGEVRWAGPGEFTQRAFLSGRIDLTEAESVAQLISAAGEAEARASHRGIRGELGARLRSLREGVLECLALIEAALDFPDEDIPEVSRETLLGRVGEVKANVERLEDATALRVMTPSSLRVVLCGFPNAGKSSLLNAICGRPLALTSPVPGTTRDPVRGVTFFEGRRLEWIDLAGTTDTEGWTFGGESDEESVIWSAVRRLTQLELESSDLVVWVVDSTGDFRASLAARERIKAPEIITVFQKADLVDSQARQEAVLEAPEAFWVSARERSGLENLVAGAVAAVERTRGAVARVERVAPSFFVSTHQQLALERIGDALARALGGLASTAGFEYVASDLRDAMAALDDVLGASPGDAVLDWVFARFCIGK